MQKPVSLKRDAGATVLANHEELRSLGVTTDGRLTPELKQTLDDAFSFGTAGAALDAPERVGIATRYYDRGDGEGRGSVQGDGRAVLLGEAAVTVAGRVIGVRELQAKGGVETGLTPNGAAPNGGHHGGDYGLDWALLEATFSDFLRKNGVRTQSWVAVQVIDDWKARLVRSGDLTRLAHLRFASQDRSELARLVKSINTRVAVELGRPALLSSAGLTRVLIDRKATELADLWWLRAVHQSTTYDNIGLFEVIDLSTATTLVRPDDERFGHTSPGYLNEPRVVMSTFAADIAWFVQQGSPQQGAGDAPVSSFTAHVLGERLLRKRMAERALEHLGLDVDDRARLLHKQKPAVVAFVRAFDAVVRERDTADPVKAKFDAFAGLAKLIDVVTLPRSEPEQVAALLEALKPTQSGGAADETLARELIDAARPLFAQALSAVTGADVCAEKVACIRDQASAINAPCEDLIHASHLTRMQGAHAKIHAGQAREVQAEINAVLRRSVRRGPEAAHNVAMRLRRGEVPRDGDEVILSRIVENGVTIEERSNGVADRVVVTVSPDAAAYGALYPSTTKAFQNPADIVAHVQMEEGGAVLVVPATVVAGCAMFSIDVGRPPACLRVTFGNAANTAWWDNNTLHYGAGHRPVLSSVLVRAELAAFAESRDRKRPPDVAGARAVNNRRRTRVRRTVPAILDKLHTAQHLRELVLRDPRAARSERT